ncbi:retinol dehydrogenase 12 [Paramyrothecium foliicola]|nr:retinol dehydrogenase 12 [Paramyrothecium foliicola]
MVFFYFGPEPGSWALGNDHYSAAHNLPLPIRKVWDLLGQDCPDPALAGTKISWISSAVEGSYAVMTKRNELLTNREDLLVAAQPYSNIEHISFSAQGGWFAKFKDGTVQITPNSLPRSFHTLASPFLDPNTALRQGSAIKSVFFGQNDELLLHVGYDVIASDRISSSILSSLSDSSRNDSRLRELSLGKNSCLCPWDGNYHFIESYGDFGTPRYMYKIPPDQFLSDMVGNIIPKLSHLDSTTNGPQQHPWTPGDFPSHNKSGLSSTHSSSTSKIDPVRLEAHQRYSILFDDKSNGRTHLSGFEVALMLKDSGVQDQDLLKIFEQTDMDHDGRLKTAASIAGAARNTIAENLGGGASKLATHQFDLSETPDQSGKVAIVTGGSEGIGYGVTYTLLKHNIAKVYILSLSEEVVRGAQNAVAKELGQEAAARTSWIKCDMGDWKRVVEVAQQIKNETNRLDILVQNAGRGIMSFEMTEFGIDRNMAVDYIGRLILTSQMFPLLKSTSRETGDFVRVVNQASNVHQSAPSDTRFDSIEELQKDIGPNGLYGRSRLANLLFSRWFDRHYTQKDEPKVLMNTTHPGIVSTKMSTVDIHEPFPLGGYGMSVGMEPFKKDQFDGALSTIYASTVVEKSGLYICPPAVPEVGSKLSQDEQLGDRLVDLTKVIINHNGERLPKDGISLIEELLSR